MKKRPLLTGSLLFAAGIYFSRGNYCLVWLLLILIMFVFLLITVFLLKKERYLSYFLLPLFFCGGAFWFSLSQVPAAHSSKFEGIGLVGEGVLFTYPRISETSSNYFLKIKKVSRGPNYLVGKCVLVVAKPTTVVYFPGDQLKFQGKIELPAIARNPGIFNYREYLARQGVFWQVNSFQGQVELIKSGQGIKSWAGRGRKKIITYLEPLLPQREKGLLLGLLFGDTHSMEAAEWEAYQKAGVVHLFAVSGLHVGLVLGFVWFLLSFFQLSRVWRLFWGSLVLIAYGFLVGWGASILRASLMAFLGLLALMVKRKNDFYNSWGAAAGLVLLICPGELFQVGFQLSFVTTGGIFYLTPWLVRKGCPYFIGVPFAAFLVSSPLLAYHFNQVSLISPLVNILAVAIFGLAAMLAFVGALGVLMVPFIAAPFFLAAGFLLFILSEIVIKAASLSGASINLAAPSLAALGLYYLFLVFLPFLEYSRYLWREVPFLMKGVIVSIIMALLLLFVWPTKAYLEIVFLDVGQGDSILIKTPRGKTALLDGGGRVGSTFSVGKKIVEPVLAHYGINYLNVMMMSHHHWDHSEGLIALMPSFRVGKFLQPPQEENSQVEVQIGELCRKKQIPRKELTAGDKFNLGKELTWEILHPTFEKPFSENNRSLVVKIKYGNCSWLLTGDIEKEGLEDLLARDVDLSADILKLPHHGSLTSFLPAFYEQVNPAGVIISVGKNNFNQPHPQILNYFREKGIPVFVTRERGAIITKSDGRKIVLRTFL